MTCRTCKFLDVPPDKDGVERIRENTIYDCTAPFPEVAHLFPFSARLTTVRRMFMFPKDGAGCPAWEKRK